MNIDSDPDIGGVGVPVAVPHLLPGGLGIMFMSGVRLPTNIGAWNRRLVKI